MKSLDERLAKVFHSVFGMDAVDDSTSIMTLEEWDSLAHIMLILELEREFGITIVTDEAIGMTSVPDLKRVLHRKGVEA